MRFMFIVQGEGRGHTTQAIAVKELVEKYGHTVDLVLVGHRGDRPINLLKNAFEKVVEFPSPNLVYKSNKRHVSMINTVTEAIGSSVKYLDALEMMNYYIDVTQPDIVINFFESLYGIYRMLYKPSCDFRSIAIGHQFMFLHPEYISMKHYPVQMWGAKLFTKLVGAGSEHIALSFYETQDYSKIHVIPPILRKHLFDVDKTKTSGDYILAYAINQSYAMDFVRMDISHPTPVHLFTEMKTPRREGNLNMHPLNGERFLNMMAGCKQVICTAGFEAVSEALYLGKPLLMRPVDGHMEQWFNAHDAEWRVKNCKAITNFHHWEDEKIEIDPAHTETFRKWVDQGERRLADILGL